MRRFHKICILLFLIFPVYLIAAKKSNVGLLKYIGVTVSADYLRFYSIQNLEYLFGGISFTGVFANTNLDRHIQDWFQESIRNDNTNRFSKVAKPIGNIYEPMGIYAGLTLLGGLTKHMTPGAMAYQFGSKSLRAIIVGAPSVGILQFVLGASRPNEDNSHWHPFHDTNSVSGHAFMGAIPFLTISKMVQPGYLKTFFYMGSVATGISRINDNKHYFSQTLAGWWIAYLAVNSLDKGKESKIRLCPTFSSNSWKLKLYFSL